MLSDSGVRATAALYAMQSKLTVMGVDNRTKEEQVADFLREGIISGKYPRGSRLKQAEIAEQLGLSITPVREALKLLEAEGYVSGGFLPVNYR